MRRRFTLILLSGILAVAPTIRTGRADDRGIAPDPASLQPIPRAAAEQAFARFAALDDIWQRRSTAARSSSARSTPPTETRKIELRLSLPESRSK